MTASPTLGPQGRQMVSMASGVLYTTVTGRSIKYYSR